MSDMSLITDKLARENLALGMVNDPRSASPLEASKALLALTTMLDHRGDGIPTQYIYGPKVAELARTMWIALLTALREHPEDKRSWQDQQEAVVSEMVGIAEELDIREGNEP